MAASPAALALPEEAFGEETGIRRGAHLLDALPYVDTLSDAETKTAEGLIEAEMKSLNKRSADYTSELPPLPPSLLPEGSFIAQLVATKTGAKPAGSGGGGDEGATDSFSLPMLEDPRPTDALDIARYSLEEPSGPARNDPAAWRLALDNARAQAEHQRARLTNLELAGTYGALAWRLRCDELDSEVEGLERRLERARSQLEATHRARRLEQEAAGRKLAPLRAELRDLWLRNAEVEAAAARLEQASESARGWAGGGEAASQRGAA